MSVTHYCSKWWYLIQHANFLKNGTQLSKKLLETKGPDKFNSKFPLQTEDSSQGLKVIIWGVAVKHVRNRRAILIEHVFTSSEAEWWHSRNPCHLYHCHMGRATGVDWCHVGFENGGIIHHLRSPPTRLCRQRSSWLLSTVPLHVFLSSPQLQ
jgi:hypothetical protein